MNTANNFSCAARARDSGQGAGPRIVALFAAACVGVFLSGCATPEASPDSVQQEAAAGDILRLLPPKLADRAGWAADIYAAFATQGIAASSENVCAVLAVTEQESSFRADPAVPGLPAIARREMHNRAERAGVPRLVVNAALLLSSSDGRTYGERIDAVRTERELSEIFEDFIARVPLGTTLFARLNPVRTGGPMQVSISFAEDHASARPYPFSVKTSIRREVFTRRGGLYFGIAHLLGYAAPYPDPLFRFADFNAGQYASRNAAFQRAVSRLSGTPLVLDGDLLPPRPQGEKTVGETEQATLSLSDRLGIGKAVITRDLQLGNEPSFERTRLYQRVFAEADRIEGRTAARAVIPAIALKSPKITRNLTTEWFARRVDDRYRRCLAKAAPNASG